MMYWICFNSWVYSSFRIRTY